MKRTKISIPFTVGEGAKMRIQMNEIANFLKQFNPGVRGTVTLDIHEDKSKALQNFYLKKILRDFQLAYNQQGERYTLSQVDEKIRRLSPMMHEEMIEEVSKELGLVRIKTIFELGASELLEFIADLKQIAAEHFDFVINDDQFYNS